MTSCIVDILDYLCFHHKLNQYPFNTRTFRPSVRPVLSTAMTANVEILIPIPTILERCCPHLSVDLAQVDPLPVTMRASSVAHGSPHASLMLVAVYSKSIMM